MVAGHINAGINSGELTCLLGANGIGKSTLLRTLSAFQPKLSGEIFIQGQEIEQYKDKELSMAISVVLTEKCEVRNMTVTELVGLGRTPYTGFWGTLDEDDKQIVERSISLVKIEKLADRMVHTLSDGERQKVMIAKALAQETPIIFLDEPTAFLDFPSKVEMMQLLHRLSRQTNKTIFLSTHDLELALQIADKIWLMDKMNGVIIGTPEDLSLNGSLSAFFAHKGIIFDIDNTLVPHGAPADERSIALFRRLKAIGYECLLLSNNKEPRVKMFNDAVHVHYIFKAGKPGVKNYEKAMDIMGTDDVNTFFVGDQLFTDVWGARNAGLYSFLVKPINPKEEIQIVLKRYLEKIVLHSYKKKLAAGGGK